MNAQEFYRRRSELEAELEASAQALLELMKARVLRIPLRDGRVLLAGFEDEVRRALGGDSEPRMPDDNTPQSPH